MLAEKDHIAWFYVYKKLEVLGCVYPDRFNRSTSSSLTLVIEYFDIIDNAVNDMTVDRNLEIDFNRI